MVDKINLGDKFSSFTDQWSPKIVATVDDYDIKIVRIEGDFVWHAHENEDEMFYVLEGSFDMHFRDRQVSLGEGEMIVVPKGTEHRPRAERECRVMVFERRGVVNTGDAPEGDMTAGIGERI